MGLPQSYHYALSMPPHVIGSFNVQLQSYQQSQQRAKKTFTTDSNEHV